jgi:hypothetical protein
MLCQNCNERPAGACTERGVKTSLCDVCLRELFDPEEVPESFSLLWASASEETKQAIERARLEAPETALERIEKTRTSSQAGERSG